MGVRVPPLAPANAIGPCSPKGARPVARARGGGHAFLRTIDLASNHSWSTTHSAGFPLPAGADATLHKAFARWSLLARLVAIAGAATLPAIAIFSLSRPADMRPS